jgi:hypothetical protein
MASVLPRSMRLPASAARIYIPVAVLATLIALIGFWSRYFGPLLAGTLETVPIIHVHAVVYVGWLALVIAQAALAATGRTALHVRVGRYGMAYGVVVILMGLATAFSQFATRIEAGNVALAQRMLFGPLTDMVVFAGVLGAAWIYRRRPEVHKRLIIVATTVLLIAAVSRLPFWRSAPPSALSAPHIVKFMLIWLSPIYVAMAYDYLKARIVHPVYLLGIVVLTAMRLRGPLRETDTWQSLSGWLVPFFS